MILFGEETYCPRCGNVDPNRHEVRTERQGHGKQEIIIFAGFTCMECGAHSKQRRKAKEAVK